MPALSANRGRTERTPAESVTAQLHTAPAATALAASAALLLTACGGGGDKSSNDDKIAETDTARRIDATNDAILRHHAYYVPKATLSGNSTASVVYYSDESKGFNKNRKTNKVDRTPRKTPRMCCTTRASWCRSGETKRAPGDRSGCPLQPAFS